MFDFNVWAEPVKKLFVSLVLPANGNRSQISSQMPPAALEVRDVLSGILSFVNIVQWRTHFSPVCQQWTSVVRANSLLFQELAASQYKRVFFRLLPARVYHPDSDDGFKVAIDEMDEASTKGSVVCYFLIKKKKEEAKTERKKPLELEPKPVDGELREETKPTPPFDRNREEEEEEEDHKSECTNPSTDCDTLEEEATNSQYAQQTKDATDDAKTRDDDGKDVEQEQDLGPSRESDSDTESGSQSESEFHEFKGKKKDIFHYWGNDDGVLRHQK
jgi:hypothetical protein